LQVLRRESDNVQIQFSKGLVDLFLVENTNDYVLAVNRRHDRHAEIDLSAANHYSESSVLRYAALDNVQLRHDLDALNDGLVMGDVYRVCRAIERAVNSVFDHHVRVARFYVNIRSSPFERIQHYGVNEFDDRRHFIGAGEAFEVEDFFALLGLSHQRHAVRP